MRICKCERNQATPAVYRMILFKGLTLALLFGPSASRLIAQTDPANLSDQVRSLTDALARTQAQLQQSQRQLDEMRAQLVALEQQISQSGKTLESPATDTSSDASQESSSLAAAVQDIREQQAMQVAQIATHEQTKVESESRYPLKVTGLLLLNGFVNTKAVDIPSTPTVAVPGSGSTGLSMRQTVLGLDARGPHLFGAHTYGDVRVDFYGASSSGSAVANYTGYYNGGTGLLRLRTAHAGMQWQSTNLSFSIDRPLISPDSPNSLTAVAIPALAWSGNLWTWNPQITLDHDFGPSALRHIRLQAALVDVADAPLSPASITASTLPPSTAEQSRWPGIEARIALIGGADRDDHESSHFGVGGYFAPHDSTLFGRRFSSWAATLDAHQRLPGRLEFIGNFYRGQALGGLGAGAYKDFAWRLDEEANRYYFLPLDDVGGWAQLSEKLTKRFELNAALGIDNAFASELYRYAVPGGNMYQNLARNRTYTGNVIYRPSVYFIFSAEYRHLVSSPIIGLPAASDIVGLGAGYRF